MSDKQYTLMDGIKCFNPEVANAYSDYPDSGFDLTDKEGENSFWVRSRNRLFKSQVERSLQSTGKTKFFEIGCGTGNFIQQIANIKNLEITGSEIYLKGLLYAKQRLPAVEFIQFDVSKGIIGDYFDIITAFDVLEHIDDDVAAISNISLMLNEGAVLIVSVPQHMFLWSTLDEIVKHKRRYSRLELLTKLRNSGLEISYVTSFLFTLFPLMWASRLFDKSRGEDIISSGTELEKRVKFSGILNWILDLFMRIDEQLIRMRLSLPFGGTLLVVAKKRRLKN